MPSFRSRGWVLWLVLAPGCSPPARVAFPATGPLSRDLEVAVGAVRAEVEADPRSATAWLKAGMTLEGGDLFSQARLCYRTAVELGAPPQAWYRWSVMAWKLGDQAEAIRTIGRALELAPAYAPSHWRLGTYLFDQGDFTAAAAAYQRATELDEGFVGAWAGLARLQLATDRPIDALALLEKLRRRFPEHTHLVVLTRTALIESGRREEAERLRVAWSALPPGNDPWQAELWPYLNKSLMDKARELLASGGAGEAVRLLEDWLAEGSGDRNARAYLAFGYHLLGRAVDARATLDSALEDDPDSVLVLSMQARIQELGGELAPALATCERVLAVDPSNGALQAQRGRILVRLGRSEEAARALRAALDLDGRGPDLWAEYGLALGTLGRWAEALAPLERAQRDGASTAGLAEALARARAESARTTEGR